MWREPVYSTSLPTPGKGDGRTFGAITERGARYTGVPQEPKERLISWAMGNLDRKTRERKNQEKRQLGKGKRERGRVVKTPLGSPPTPPLAETNPLLPLSNSSALSLNP